MATSAATLCRIVLLGLAVLLIGAPLVLAVQLARQSSAPHRLEVGLVGPVLVTQVLAERAAARGDDALLPVVLKESADPTDGVRRGLLDAAVTIDFGVAQDVLYVSSTADPSVVAEVRRRVEATSRSYGRTIVVREVPSARSPDTWRGTPYVVVLGWIGTGAAVAVLLVLWLGPLSAVRGQARRRFVVLSSASLVAGGTGAAVLALVAGTSFWGLLAVGALAVAATTWLALAAEALAGLVGLAAAVSLSLATMAPLLARTDLAALPAPWASVAPWTVAGAAETLTRNEVFFGADVGPRPFVVLLTWAVLALLTVLTARREAPVGAEA